MKSRRMVQRPAGVRGAARSAHCHSPSLSLSLLISLSRSLSFFSSRPFSCSCPTLSSVQRNDVRECSGVRSGPPWFVDCSGGSERLFSVSVILFASFSFSVLGDIIMALDRPTSPPCVPQRRLLRSVSFSVLGEIITLRRPTSPRCVPR
jgi:hypothetical protein